MADMHATIESVVAKIWQDILEVDRVTPADNFLDLGGNSLRAGEIAWRIRDELGVELSIDVLLDTETFGDFVATIATEAKGAAPQTS
jgi:acyl carrier protein